MAPSQPTRWSLVLGAAAGEEDRKDAFARRYGPVLASYFAARWKLARDHERVVDAVQDAFVQLFKHEGALHQVDPTRSGGFRAYLFGLAGNVASMAERQRGRRWKGGERAIGTEFDSVESPDPSITRSFDRAWAAMLAREARRRMAEHAARGDERDAMRFRCLEARFAGGQTPRDIALEVGVPQSEVYERLREGRLRFRQFLMEVVAEHNPGASPREVERICRELAGML